MSQDKRTRRHFTPEEKATILRRHLADKIPVSDLCDEYGIQPTLLCLWQRQALEHLGEASPVVQDNALPNHPLIAMTSSEISKQILFVQGAGQHAHDAWDSKLVRSLQETLGDGYAVRYPRMPNEADPHYSTWKTALVQELDRIEPGAIVIGHSVGGTFLIHVLAENRPKRKLAAIALIAAPFVGEGGWPADEIEPRADFTARLPAQVPLFLYHGTADDVVPPAHLALWARLLPHAVVRSLAGRNHQLDDDLGDVARDIRSATQ